GEAPDVADRLIRFLDLDGRLLALRYDFTASVARLAATKLADRPTPLRLSYAGKVFRQDPEREGRRPREILQVGGELLGEAATGADVEVLRLALGLVRASGAREFQVNLGHVGALAPALARLPPEERAAVRRLSDRKDAAGLAAAGAAVGAGGRYDDLMARFGRALPAVGLALDLDTLVEAVPVS